MDITNVKALLGSMDSEQSRFANKALDYYDGNQLTHMVNVLNHPSQGRKDWQGRGMRVSYRNLTGSIIDKSGLLFLNGRPDVIVRDDKGGELDDDTFLLHQMLNASDFEEVMVNFDSVLRMLKTALILTQYDNESQSLSFDILHRGNCAVMTKGFKREVSALLFKTGESAKGCYYRTIDEESIQDWHIGSEIGSSIELLETNENIYGKVPVTVFHDIKVPRDGFWNHIPQDLVCFNEEYNLYLVDTLYAASYANRKTLYTNASFTGDDDETLEVQEFYGDPLPRQTYGSGGITTGPDKMIQIDTSGVENVFMEYMGPDIKLEEIRKLFAALVKDIASDWSVRIKVEGEGTANSGFQVVVEEMDNLELRKQRQQHMSAGMTRLFDCVQHLTNVGEGMSIYNDESVVDVQFAKPSLPVDDYKEDEMWINRIAAGLASRVDYMMSKYNLSREQAEMKVLEIDGGQSPEYSQ